MSAGIRLRSFAAVLLCVLGVGQTHGETPWTAVLSQQALAAGHQATLSPNLSMVLGLATKPQSVAVRQLATRAEQKVHTFNVSVAHHQDLVILYADEGTRTTVAYLLAPGGRLRKAVSYQTGGPPQELSAAEAKVGFAGEVRYWSGLAHELGPGPAH